MARYRRPKREVKPLPAINKIRRWDAIIKRIDPNKEIVGAEIGVWVGSTAQKVLEARPLVMHIMIDSWKTPEPGSSYAKSDDSIARQKQAYFDECYEKTKDAVRIFKERAVILRQTSFNASQTIQDKSLDYVFIDAEHTYEGVSADIKLWLPKVKPGGWIGGHDYGNLPRFPGVQKAVDEAFPEGVELDGDCTWFKRIKQ
jgi:hypothetical protein